MAKLSLRKNAKFKALAKTLKLPPPYVQGLLDTMWDSAHAKASPLLGAPADVELAAEWPGESGVLFAALRDGGWIEELGSEADTWQIHDYWDHAPEEVVREALRLARQIAPAPVVESGAKPVKFDPAAMPLPPVLDTREFRSAWVAWHATRRKLKHKPWLPETCDSWLRKLAGWGADRAIAALLHSVERQYQGVYEPKAIGSSRVDNHRPTRPAGADLSVLRTRAWQRLWEYFPEDGTADHEAAREEYVRQVDEAQDRDTIIAAVKAASEDARRVAHDTRQGVGLSA